MYKIQGLGACVPLSLFAIYLINLTTILYIHTKLKINCPKTLSQFVIINRGSCYL